MTSYSVTRPQPDNLTAERAHICPGLFQCDPTSGYRWSTVAFVSGHFHMRYHKSPEKDGNYLSKISLKYPTCQWVKITAISLNDMNFYIISQTAHEIIVQILSKSCNSDVIDSDHIKSQFCTCYDNAAVVKWAKWRLTGLYAWQLK